MRNPRLYNQLTVDLATKLVDMLEDVTDRWTDIASEFIPEDKCEEIVTATCVLVAATMVADTDAPASEIGRRFAYLVSQRRQPKLKRRRRK